MKPLYGAFQFEPINPETLRPDFDGMKKFEPVLVDEALTCAAVVEWLEEEHERAIMNAENLKGKDRLHYLNKIAVLKPLLDRKQAEKDRLWLTLRICELIHKYDLADEVAE